MRGQYFALVTGVLLVLVFPACSSVPATAGRIIEPEQKADLVSSLTDSDADKVSGSLVLDCLGSDMVMNYIQEFSVRHGRRPTLTVGPFRNFTSEHIDSAMISRSMEKAFANSGKLEIVAWEARHDAGVNLMFTGRIIMTEERAGNVALQTYIVSAELISAETNSRLWSGDNNEIKKVTSRPIPGLPSR